jgi:hypothetical protein
MSRALGEYLAVRAVKKNETNTCERTKLPSTNIAAEDLPALAESSIKNRTTHESAQHRPKTESHRQSKRQREPGMLASIGVARSFALFDKTATLSHPVFATSRDSSRLKPCQCTRFIE